MVICGGLRRGWVALRGCRNCSLLCPSEGLRCTAAGTRRNEEKIKGLSGLQDRQEGRTKQSTTSTYPATEGSTTSKMTTASARRQPLDAIEGAVNPRPPKPRSLSAMLANPHQASAPDSSQMVEVRSEEELHGVSKLVPLKEDFTPLFQGAPLLSGASRADNQCHSSRDLLVDLFPAGFTSRALFPSEVAAAAAAAAPSSAATTAHHQPESSANETSLREEEPELAGKQTWTGFMPGASTAPFVTSTLKNSALGTGLHLSTHHAKDGPQRPSRLHHYEAFLPQKKPDYSYQASDKGKGKIGQLSAPTAVESTKLEWSKAKDLTTSRMQIEEKGADDGAEPRSEYIGIVNGSGQEMDANEVKDVRDREDELKSALDRSISRFLMSEERVKFLERSLEQAKQAELGRNALVKQVKKLEEEVKHSRHRLEKHHAEALEWREKRQSLEADNSRLRAELHSALGRSTRLETEKRRKDSLLVHNTSTLATELCHKNQLVLEAEQDKERGQSTENPARIPNAAMIRAEPTALKVSGVHSPHSDASWQNNNRRNTVVDFVSPQQSNKSSQSLMDVVSGASTAVVPGRGGDGGLEAVSRSWGPPESRRVSGAPLTWQYRDRGLAKSLSPERGRLEDYTSVPHRDETASGAPKEVVQGSTAGVRERLPDQDEETSIVPFRVTAVATDGITPKYASLDTGEKDGDLWAKNGGLLSPSKEVQEAQSAATPTAVGPGWWVRSTDINSPPARPAGREYYHDVGKERYDSEGVKGALTGATPAWTDASSRQGGRSRTVTGGFSGGGGGGSDAGGTVRDRTSSAGLVTREHLAAGVPRKGCEYQLLGDGCFEDENFRDYDGNITGEGQPRRAELTRELGEINGTVNDQPPTVSKSWKLEASQQWCPAAGHRRGRDLLSSRRSSLSGAGVGVTDTLGGANEEKSRIEAAGCRTQLTHGHPAGSHAADSHDFNIDAFGGRRKSAGHAEGFDGQPPSTASPVDLDAANNPSPTDRRRRLVSAKRRSSEPGSSRSNEEGSAAVPSTAPTKRTVSFANVLGGRDCPDTLEKDTKAFRERRLSAPFATDAAEDELRPVREVERRLMLLQMETSQLEAEQSKLAPKASKKMQVRAQMERIDSRLALLARESSTLRRVLREKPCRL